MIDRLVHHAEILSLKGGLKALVAAQEVVYISTGGSGPVFNRRGHTSCMGTSNPTER